MTVLRLSLGSAIVLGLREGALPHPPTTAYLMVGGRCSSGCLFCTQGRAAVSGSDKLSRVTWPGYDIEAILGALGEARDRGLSRLCLQVLVDHEALEGLPRLVKDLKGSSGLPISLSISPVPAEFMGRLKDSGADRIGIALDGASEEVFERIKGGSAGNPYSYEGHKKALGDALKVFGRGNVSTHIIVGLGESDRDVFETMRWCREKGVLASLFAYTHVKGTPRLGDPPGLARYRALQVMRHLVFERNAPASCARFDATGRAVWIDWAALDDLGMVFRTRGCPDCNRPYYTESPKGPIFNYPYDYGREIGGAALREAVEYVGR